MTLLEEMQAYDREHTLPHIVFFKPTPEFIQRVKDTGKNVVDVGAGCGFLSKQLADAGIKVLAIDNIRRERPFFQVFEFDATLLRYPQGSLPIMARPCHNEWIETAIDRAMQTVDEVWYVGLEKNFAEDLCELGHYDLHYDTWIAGEVGETVVRITKRTKS